jgi:PTH1 family peptidyl-tRNA hydrolase
MRLVIGLGNPGSGYQNTRHNAGFLVLDELKKLKSTNLQIYKSTNFMNESGEFVGHLLSKYPSIPVSSIYIVHDDLDIPLGSYKIQFGRGPKDHNGLKSVDEALGTDQYWHIRVGVDNRPLDNRPMGEEYVLQNFSDEEKLVLDKVIKEVCKKLATL